MKQYNLDDETLERAVLQADAAARRVATEKNEAPDHLTTLLAIPRADRVAAVLRERRFQTYALALNILERSVDVIFHHPRAALELTYLARVVTAQIDPRTCGGPEALADLRAYALAREANTQRVCGEITASLAAFSRAREVQRRGGVDLHLGAQIDLMEASLRRDLGQLRTSLRLLQTAEEGVLELGEHDLWSLVLINRSNVFQVQEEFDQAAMILEEASGGASDLHASLCIRHNLVYLLAKSGRPCEAAQLLERSRSLYRWFSDPLTQSRRMWVEGLIACGLGEDRLAESLLDEAVVNLSECGYAFDSALAGLDQIKMKASRRGEPLYTC